MIETGLRPVSTVMLVSFVLSPAFILKRIHYIGHRNPDHDKPEAICNQNVTCNSSRSCTAKIYVFIAVSGC